MFDLLYEIPCVLDVMWELPTRGFRILKGSITSEPIIIGSITFEPKTIHGSTTS